MTDLPPHRLALTTDKRPMRPGMLNGPSATAPATTRELDRAPLAGIVPRSIGCVVIDIDGGELPAAEREAAIVRVFGEPVERNDTRRDGGVHLWYRCDCSFTGARFDLSGRVTGDIRHDRTFAVEWSPETAERARLRAKAGEGAAITKHKLRTLASDWGEGARHDTLLRRSWSAAQNGEDAEAVARMGIAAGLSQREADSAIRNLPVATVAGGGLKRSQLQWAQSFAREVSLASQDGQLMRWDTLVGWETMDRLALAIEFGNWTGERFDRAEAQVRGDVLAFVEAVQAGDAGKVEGLAPALAKMLKNADGITAIREKVQGKTYAEAVAEMACTIAEPGEWNAQPYLCGLPGARLFDLETGKVRAMQPDHRVTLALATAPAEPADVRPEWEAHLERTIGRMADGTPWPDAAERLAWFQRMIGAAVVGDADNDAILILCGGGGTGKSTIRETVFRAIGTYASALNGEQVVGMRAEHKSAMMPLRHARMIGIAELPATAQSWRCSFLKAITGGDSIQANWKYQNEVSFRPHGRIVITTNAMPSAASTVQGLGRRFRIVDMNHELPNDGSKAIIESDALLPTVVRWGVIGAREYIAHGEGAIPDSVRRAVELWEADNDVFARFASECEIVATGDPADRLPVAQVRRLFGNWCSENRVNLNPASVTQALRGKPWFAVDCYTANGKKQRALGGLRVGVGDRHAGEGGDLPF